MSSGSIAVLQQEYVPPKHYISVLLIKQYRVIGVYISGSANGRFQVRRLDLSRTHFSVVYCILVLFLFDCLITLSQEIDVLWGRKWTATTWLYMLTRYNTVIRQIILDIPLWTDMVSRIQRIMSEVQID